MEVFKITYDDSKTGNSWRATVVAMARKDAEELLRKKVQFSFTITHFEELGKIDAFSDEALNLINNSTTPKKRQYKKKKDQPEKNS